MSMARFAREGYQTTHKRALDRKVERTRRAAEARERRGFTEIPEGSVPGGDTMPEQVKIIAAKILSGATVKNLTLTKAQLLKGGTVIMQVARRDVRAAQTALKFARKALKIEREFEAKKTGADPATLPFWTIKQYLKGLLGKWY